MDNLRESIYSSNNDGINQVLLDDESSSVIVSDYVHNVANGIYKEFEALISVYGESVVKNLMPLVVPCLETLDRIYSEKHNIEVEFELLKEDSSQLMMQYEREKHLRKDTQENLFKAEDNFVEKCNKYEEKMQRLESLQKMYEIRLKNSQDQILRFEEKDVERQKENEKLHLRYNELMKYHMEYLEKSRIYQTEVVKLKEVEKNDQLCLNKDKISSEKIRSNLVTQTCRDVLEKNSDNLDFKSTINTKGDICLSEELEQVDIIPARHPYKFPQDNIAEWDLTSIKSDEFNMISECEEITAGSHILAFDDELAGMTYEIKCIIKENNELIATKNALNIVKDDLISKLDEANSEIEIMHHENNCLNTMKTSLKLRLNDLELENKSLKQDVIYWKQKVTDDNDEENIPLSQRKRFNRVEMARVLMERNQYKERLLELEERFKLTVMSQNKKERSLSIWERFSRLFKVQNNQNSSSSSINEKSSERRKESSEESKKNDSSMNCLALRDPERQQINGWSLPKLVSSKIKTSLPIPIYCRPLSENQSGLKVNPTLEITFAVAVNMTGGRSLEGDMHVGGSIFYNCKKSKQAMNVDLLEVEEKINQSHIITEFGNLTSIQYNDIKSSSETHVWIATSSNDQSQIIVINANRPSDYLDTFTISNSPVQCLGSIPGASPKDYIEKTVEVSEEFNVSSSSVTSELLPKFRIRKVQCVPYEEYDENEPINFDVTVDRKIYETLMKKVDFSPMKINMTESDSLNTEEKKFPDSDDSNVSSDSLTPSINDCSSIQPSIWIGCRNGDLFVHPATGSRSHCLHQIRLSDSITNIIYQDSRVFVSLANGSLAVFRRFIPDDCQPLYLVGQWQMSNYYLIEPDTLGHSIRCLEGVALSNSIWIGYRNQVIVVNDKTLSFISSIEAHPRSEYTVRQMCCAGDGVWISLRLDTILRLFHAFNFQHLQDLNVEPHINKLIEPSLLGLSLLRITCLSASCHRMWIGTNNGMIICAPFLPNPTNKKPTVQEQVETLLTLPSAESLESLNKTAHSPTFIPFINHEDLQLSYHGHRDAVKFFITVRSDSSNFKKTELTKKAEVQDSPLKSKYKYLMLSGGEGYKDFRISENVLNTKSKYCSTNSRGSIGSVDQTMINSHLIVWQLSNLVIC